MPVIEQFKAFIRHGRAAKDNFEVSLGGFVRTLCVDKKKSDQSSAFVCLDSLKVVKILEALPRLSQ